MNQNNEQQTTGNIHKEVRRGEIRKWIGITIVFIVFLVIAYFVGTFLDTHTVSTSNRGSYPSDPYRLAP